MTEYLVNQLIDAIFYNKKVCTNPITVVRCQQSNHRELNRIIHNKQIRSSIYKLKTGEKISEEDRLNIKAYEYAQNRIRLIN
jgi:hypothetical protein